jgi:hypothetical protein
MLQEKKELANKMREYAMNILCEIILLKDHGFNSKPRSHRLVY